MNLYIKQHKEELIKATEIYINCKYWWFGKVIFSKFIMILPLFTIFLWSYFKEYRTEALVITFVLSTIIFYLHWQLSWYIEGYSEGITKDRDTQYVEY